MKRYIIIGLLALSACNSNNNTDKQEKEPLPATLVNNPHTASGVDDAAAAVKPVLSFKDTVFKFGTIHEAEVVKNDFEFTNTGKTPLIISSASATCGCTVAEYPREAIAPGKNGVIKVSFNSAGKSGTQQKTVILHTNTLRSVHMLYLQGEVVKNK
jgi:outer membrane biosynthesis protein TonB